jgi:uncharacterized protein
MAEPTHVPEVTEHTAAASPPRSALGAMNAEEAAAFLRAQTWGVLATGGPGGPYAVPVSYAWDGERILLATGAGEKSRAIEAEPRVSLTVTEVDSGDRWRCVIVRGRARWLDEPLARVRALGTLARRQARQAGGLDVSPSAIRRLMDARVVVIEPTEVSGRVRG